MTLYHQVPKTLKENLEYRRELISWADTSDRRRSLWTACKQDILFFINAFCWLYEPRSSRLRGTTSNVIPFLTYEYQDEAFLQMKEVLGLQDIGVEKSRDLGATWMFLTLFFHGWMFEDFSSFGIMSRTADLVDKPGKKDTLFWKLDFLLHGEGRKGGLPKWMRPKNVYRSMMLMENRDNGSTFEGATTTEDAFRGGRKKAIALDEFAAFPNGADYEAQSATQHATDCRVFVSTPKGSAGAYYDVMHTPSSMVKIIMDWKKHPDRSKGMYTTEGTELQIIDKEYKFPAGYDYVFDGKVRSPYYDAECLRPGATPQSVAQELDRDYGGSDYQIFGKDLYEAGQKNVMMPFVRGVFGYDSDTLDPIFDRSDDGPLRLWVHLDNNDRPTAAHSEYVIGCDISAGLGGSYTSNSVATVINAVSKTQVGEFATNTMRPGDFADYVVALCRFFHNAYLIWEYNGSPGGAFTKQVLDQKYPNIYFREVEHKNFKKKTKNPGWWSNERNKLAVLSSLAKAIKSEEFLLRSTDLLEECRQYVYKDGRVVHSRSVRTIDDSSKGQAHGDRVIAAALAWHAVKDRPSEPKEEYRSEIPIGSMAWRFKERESRMEKLYKDGWD
tara:strand:+ start:1500 stop:3332 length:1833 start_codon:yes stop_codon:yes gene_type:complete